MVQTDSLGIQWLLATGEQTLIEQSRFNANDYRWSRNYENALMGFEVTGIISPTDVATGGHYALKHWGPNHSSPCGYEEDGQCCCWYDTGIRANGDVQTQIERPHPDNSDWSCPECTMSNIGQSMDGNDIGLKWIFYPIIQNGSAANGGMRIQMYKSTSALVGGVPANNWVIVYDIIDNSTRDILDTSDWNASGNPSYEAPEEQEIEVRVSDTDTADFYGGGIHVRRFVPTDIYGGGTGCPPNTHFDTATQTCVPNSTACPAGQHWDFTQGKCVLDSVPLPPTTPPTGTAVTDLKLYLSGGNANIDPTKSLGGHMSTKEVLGSFPHELLDRVSLSEMQSGLTDFHLFYLKNTNTLFTFNNVKIFVLQNTINPFDSILVGLAAAGKNMDEQPLNVDTDVPAGVTFTAAESTTSGLLIPSLGPNEKIGLWIKRVLNQGATAHPANIAKIAIDFSPAGTPTQPNVPPTTPPIVCPSGQHWDFNTNQCVLDTVTPPTPPADIINFTVCMFGDMGCSSRFTSSYSRAVARNPVRILGNGDLGYDDGQECWLDIVSNERDKWILAMGNHDVNEGESQPSTENATRSFGRFPPNRNYYSTTFNNVGILVFDSEDNPDSNPQRDFMVTELQTLANNPAIEWIFVMHHRPMYGSDSNHPNEVDVREYWHPLFDQNKVDCVFASHNHNKEASALLKYNPSDSDAPVVTSTGGAYSYSRGTVGHGVLFWHDGSGGDDLYSIDSEADYEEFSNDSVNGYTVIDFSENGKKATFKHIDRNNNLLYTASITHRV